jgi:hypothetical protein
MQVGTTDGTKMTIWRMAMRHGDYGRFAHGIYIPMGVGAVTYNGIAEVDFSDIPLKEAKNVWRHLAPTQIASLKHLCYDIAGGDSIFVKAGPMIVNRGVVRGAAGQRAYRFNYARPDSRVGTYEHWFQQVPVAWRDDFVPIRIQAGSNQRHAIQEISAADAARIMRGVDQELANAPTPSDREELLRTESYLRATLASMRLITPRHNQLSNQLRRWLQSEHSLIARQEQAQIDLLFSRGNIDVVAELKVCEGGSTRHAIREAMGQLLEYNFYPSRRPSREWLIVLDSEPTDNDRRYVELLRESLQVPLFLGWRSDGRFSFVPAWPPDQQSCSVRP